MKVTLDTNVLISATFWYGPSLRVIELIENKEVTLVLSKEILHEYGEVLQYDEIQNKIKNKNLEMKLSVEKIMSLSFIVDPKRKIEMVSDDPDDNMVLECAYEGNVDYIITQDKHLLRIKKFEGIEIT